MTWFGWVCLVAAIAVLGLAVQLWLWWRLWRKARALAEELSSVATQVATVSAQLGELGLAASRAGESSARREVDRSERF